MIAELLILQGLLEKTDMVTPSQTKSSTSTYVKAEAAEKDYADKARDYLRRFRR